MLYANILCLGNEIFGSFCFWLIPSGETLDLSLTNVLLDYKSTDHLAPIHVAWKETIVKSELQLTHEFSTWNKMSILVKQLGEGEFQSSRLCRQNMKISNIDSNGESYGLDTSRAQQIEPSIWSPPSLYIDKWGVMAKIQIQSHKMKYTYINKTTFRSVTLLMTFKFLLSII